MKYIRLKKSLRNSFDQIPVPPLRLEPDLLDGLVSRPAAHKEHRAKIAVRRMVAIAAVTGIIGSGIVLTVVNADFREAIQKIIFPSNRFEDIQPGVDRDIYNDLQFNPVRLVGEHVFTSKNIAAKGTIKPTLQGYAYTYYEWKEGSFLSLEPQVVRTTFAFGGQTFGMDFDYCISNGELVLLDNRKGEYEYALDDGIDYRAVRPVLINGRTDMILLELRFRYVTYTVGYRLSDQTVVDLFGGVDVPALSAQYQGEPGNSQRRRWAGSPVPSPDGQKVRFTSDRSGGLNNYCLDLKTGKISSMGFVEAPVQNDESRSKTGFIGWVDDTHVAYASNLRKEDLCAVYDLTVVDLETGAHTVILSAQSDQASNGNSALVGGENGRYFFAAENDQLVCVDLLSGDKRTVDGVTLPKGSYLDVMNMSPDGNRVAFTVVKPKISAAGEMGDEYYVEVVDLRKGKSWSIERSHIENKYLDRVGWLDNDSLCVTASDSHLEESTTKDGAVFVFRFGGAGQASRSQASGNDK